MTSVISLGPGEGRQFWTGMAQGRVKVDSGTVDFSVFESRPRPGAKPPLHVHRTSDEAWYVIEGTITFAFGAERSEREADSFVFVPRGVVHAFANLGPGQARVLVIGSPQIAAMVEDAGRAGDVSAGTFEPAAILKRYDTDVIGAW
jgi:mannose-6-phosphate isomerase-like protein (cupin superfamily)